MANTTVSDERRRLRDRLADLDAERGHIAYALSVLDRIDSDAQDAAGPMPQAPRRRQTVTPRVGGTFEHAVRMVNSSGRTWQVEDLVEAMKQDGWAADVASPLDTVRSSLSRAVKAGQITRPRQGVYAPSGWDDIVNSEVAMSRSPTAAHDGESVHNETEHITDAADAPTYAPSVDARERGRL